MLESVELNISCLVSADGALTARGKTTDPLAIQEDSPEEAAMENSPPGQWQHNTDEILFITAMLQTLTGVWKFFNGVATGGQ